MKSFKKLINEVKREDWDSFVHSMFGGPEQDIKRNVKLDPPHVRFARERLFSSLDWNYGTPEGKKTKSLPITKVEDSGDTVAIHLDARMYHSDLLHHDIDHNDSNKIHMWTGENARKQPSSQMEAQDLISRRLGDNVPIHRVENNMNTGKLVIHVPSVSVQKALKTFKDVEQKRIEKYERDNDENF